MKKILIPIDLSGASENAIDFALDVFSGFKPELLMIHVKQPNEDLEYLKTAFGQLENSKLYKTGIQYNFEITRGELLEDIQAAIDTEKPDLLVMGTTGINGSELSKALVKLTNCPLMLVPENYHWSKIKRIAYANDFKNIKDSAVLHPLMILAQKTEAKVYLLHVNRDNSVVDNAEASLEYYLEHVHHEYICITSDDIESAIMNFIKEKDIDMLAVLLRDHGKNQLSSEGRLVKELVVNSNVPVLNLV
ncbi:universal stress protein [Fulvivirga sp. M361]|uniref:universal stress protein n=1 Tax=Fulvivirga sp. M361 TaxID=2594266 RepID=UPI00117A2ACA|nr:universal stress protein [Fulvivirga sp. M361]TRX59589.1 universal stress protein [Fulvivirga sp. M361]